MKSGLRRNYSRAEFERLSHPEKLQYLTELLDALDPPPQAADRTIRAAAGIGPLPEPSGQEAD